MARKHKVLPLLERVEITGVAAEGKALAKIKLREHDEAPMVVFVPYGAPGDIADIKIDKKKRNFAEGHIANLVIPSPLRINPRCSHFGYCGGCKWQHLPYSEQLEFKRKQVEDAFNHIGKLNFPEIPEVLPSDPSWEYRNKLEYTFSNKRWKTWEEMKDSEATSEGEEALGFHIPGCFDKVLHVDQCFLQNNKGNQIKDFFYEFAIKHGLGFYDIKNNTGFLRNLMIRISSTGQIMVCLVVGEDNKSLIEEMLKAAKDRFPEVTSWLYIINTKFNDSIADQDVLVFSGSEFIEEQMEDLKFRINAKSFYQTNSLQAFELYKVARKFAGLDRELEESKRPTVYDLYTGAGTIANFVARNSRKVIGVEYVPEAIEDAKVNSKINGIDNTSFYAGDMKDVLTADFVRENGDPDIMIIDPPRAGMHENVVKVILSVSPKVIVYVSCNPATQARDLSLLSEKYKITDVQPVDMFPHTHHVENVVRLELIDSDPIKNC